MLTPSWNHCTNILIMDVIPRDTEGVHSAPPAYVWILYTVTSSFGVITNTLALCLFMYKRALLYGTMNILILNQVILDLAVSISILGYTLQTLPTDLSDDLDDNLYCILWLSKMPRWILFVNSTYNVVAITFDRYVAICHPIWYRTKYAPWKLSVIIIAVWLTGPVFEGIHYAFTSHIANRTCIYFSYESTTASVIAGVTYFVYSYIVPFGLILFGHIQILRTLKSRRHLLLEHPGLDLIYRNMLGTVALISIVIFSCWTLEQCFYLLYNLQIIDMRLDTWYSHIFVNLVFANVFLNPIIFVFKYREFRLVILDIFNSLRAKCFINSM